MDAQAFIGSMSRCGDKCRAIAIFPADMIIVGHRPTLEDISDPVLRELATRVLAENEDRNDNPVYRVALIARNCEHFAQSTSFEIISVRSTWKSVSIEMFARLLLERDYVSLVFELHYVGIDLLNDDDETTEDIVTDAAHTYMESLFSARYLQDNYARHVEAAQELNA